jgi:hypothetical protein
MYTATHTRRRLPSFPPRWLPSPPMVTGRLTMAADGGAVGGGWSCGIADKHPSGPHQACRGRRTAVARPFDQKAGRDRGLSGSLGLGASHQRHRSCAAVEIGPAIVRVRGRAWLRLSGSALAFISHNAFNLVSRN